MRIFFARTAQPLGRIAGQPELAGVEGGMLAGEDQAGRDAVRGQRMRQRSQFDRFGPGADNQ
jgi:hypothetical protein